MNTNKLKAYAPKARVAFMEAVKSRAAKLGIFEDRISDITIDGDNAIIEKEVYSRKQGQQRNQLVKRIEALGTHDGKFVHKDGFNQFINETAFTWFNRLTAIRYMEVNEYLDHGFRVISKAEGAQFGEGFEILNSAADVADELGLNKDQIIDMVLDGNKEEELYRTLLLGQCHQLSEAMPFMFEKLDDATELLLPDNLTKTDSILKDLVNDIPEENWQEIEVIGWLYQFYISEHKDAVIGKVVKREDIPAATQLFTPNWIVKYLVQNSLGRQWLATYPDSELKDKMEYYITPAEQSDDVIEQLKAITPTRIDPEDIKVLDPACGSGHILVEVYEVLREIYLERGYRLRDIPELILTKNIYGLDIDDRAAQMAAFAILMKAREDDKRIFTRDIKLNIHSIQSTENLNINQLWDDLDLDDNKQTGSMGDLFAEPQLELTDPTAQSKVYLDLLNYLKEQFIDAKNLGSLIEVESIKLETLIQLEEKLANKAQSSEPMSKKAAEALLPVIQQSIILARKYDVAVANPPYMNSKGMNTELRSFAKDTYPASKSDLFSVYIEKCLSMGNSNAKIGLVTPYVWMFISAYEELRKKILNNFTLSSLVQLEYNAFAPACIPVCAFTINKSHIPNFNSSFIKLSEFKGHEAQAPKTLEAIKNNDCGWFYRRKPKSFSSIPSSPLGYWIDEKTLQLFSDNESIGHHGTAKTGMTTGNIDLFTKHWYEVDFTSIAFNCNSREETLSNGKKWYPYSKGGSFRKWYGNNLFVVNWENDGSKLREFKGSTVRSPNFYFQHNISWSEVSSSKFSARSHSNGFIFDTSGPALFVENEKKHQTLAYLCSNRVNELLEIINPTLHYLSKNVESLPIPNSVLMSEELGYLAQKAVELSKLDWNSFESSWEFTPPFTMQSSSINKSWDIYNAESTNLTNSLLMIENKINSLIDSMTNRCGVDLSIEEISLNRNLCYKRSKTDELESIANRFQSEYVTNLLSYNIGCIMGRYSLDREGITYAHSGNNGFKDLVAEGAWKTFPADDDGILPLADEDWVFEDDATTRFRQFVKTVWGEEHLQENLDFVAESLCLDAIKAKKGESSMDTIRRYFSTQFYKDHLKTYKKRPIYWLFSSGKAKAFECLVYLHRYNEGTLSRMRTEYVTPLMGKLESRKNILEDSKATASGAELRAIDKELKTIEKKQAELVTFDEELKHLAEMKISLDLDDGVKVNYGKFGNLLADVKAIHGKNPEVIK